MSEILDGGTQTSLPKASARTPKDDDFPQRWPRKDLPGVASVNQKRAPFANSPARSPTHLSSKFVYSLQNLVTGSETEPGEEAEILAHGASGSCLLENHLPMAGAEATVGSVAAAAARGKMSSLSAASFSEGKGQQLVRERVRNLLILRTKARISHAQKTRSMPDYWPHHMLPGDPIPPRSFRFQSQAGRTRSVPPLLIASLGSSHLAILKAIKQPVYQIARSATFRRFNHVYSRGPSFSAGTVSSQFSGPSLLC